MGSINAFKFNSRLLKCLDYVGILFFQIFRFCRSKEILIIKDLRSGNLLILGILSDLGVELSVTAYEVRICIKDVAMPNVKNPSTYQPIRLINRAKTFLLLPLIILQDSFNASTGLTSGFSAMI
jgi:hypothetical protein